MKKKFGIDLGTTNSAMSVYTGNNSSKMIILDSGKTTMPSCVMWLGGENWVVGEEAYMNRYKENVCYSIKNKMGSDYKAIFKYEGEEKELTPTEVSSLILKELVKRARHLYPNIEDVTITVPADFIAKQREETKKAGEAIGLNVVAIISEPTSAALCYPNSERSKEVLVYDLGGGTFDVSIVSIEDYSKEEEDNTVFDMLGVSLKSEDKSATDKRYEVLVSEGDRNLGGDDIDDEIIKILFKNYNKLNSKGKLGIPRIQDIITEEELEKLKLRVERHKKDLDSGMATSVFMEVHGHTLTLERKYVEEGIRRVYNKTKLLMGRALANNKVDRNNVKEIVLVGGSTKSLVLQRLIADGFSECKVSSALNPDEAVAMGASIQTAVTTGVSSTSIMDVSPYTISVETISETVTGDLVRGKTVPLIRKNTLLPVRVVKQFAVHNESKTLVTDLFLGENVLVSELNHVASVELEREESGDQATLIVIVDSNGIFKIKVESGGSEREVELLNILGVTMKEKKVSPYSRLVSRWESILETKKVKITEELRNALDSFKENGDAESKAIIQKHMDSLEHEEITREKTTLFSSTQEDVEEHEDGE